MPQLDILFPNITFNINPESRTVFSITTSNQWDLIKQFLISTDLPLRQIQVTIKIVEAHTNTVKKQTPPFTSLIEGLPLSINPIASTVALSKPLLFTLEHMLKTGSANLIAEPTITVLNNQTATIEIGDRLPYSSSSTNAQQKRTLKIDYLNAGIAITLKPSIVQNDHILTTIDLVISSIKLWKDIGQGHYPILSRRHTNTDVHLKPNTPVAISSIINRQDKRNESHIPLLGDLPIIGHLFRENQNDKSTSSIFFIISATILQ